MNGNDETDTLRRVVALLGGRTAFGCEVATLIQAHDIVDMGVPIVCVDNLLACVPGLARDEVFRVALDMRWIEWANHRARYRVLHARRGSLLWSFADMLSGVMDVSGDATRALAWIFSIRSDMGGRAPIEVMATPPGYAWVRRCLAQDAGIRETRMLLTA